MKRLLAVLLTLVLALSLFACTEKEPAQTDGQMKKFTVTVVHADGSKKDFTYESDAEFVGPVLMEAGLIQGEDGPYGLMITEVDGEKIEDTNKAYWAIFEGEEYAMQGIDTTPVVDGQVYKLEYTLV